MRARRPTADLRLDPRELLAAAQQPTQNVADRTALIPAEHPAQNAAEGVIAATGGTATTAEDAAQHVTDTSPGAAWAPAPAPAPAVLRCANCRPT